MEWLLVHGNDEEPPAQAAGVVDADSIAMLEGMGFTADKAKAALVACGNNVERAVDWLFSRMDEDIVPPASEDPVPPAPVVEEGSQYKGTISSLSTTASPPSLVFINLISLFSCRRIRARRIFEPHGKEHWLRALRLPH